MEIKVDENKTVILHIDEKNGLVYSVEILTPNDLQKKSTILEPTGISKEQAIQKYCYPSNGIQITDV